jgi:hypothetical protein
MVVACPQQVSGLIDARKFHSAEARNLLELWRSLRPEALHQCTPSKHATEGNLQDWPGSVDRRCEIWLSSVSKLPEPGNASLLLILPENPIFDSLAGFFKAKLPSGCVCGHEEIMARIIERDLAAALASIEIVNGRCHFVSKFSPGHISHVVNTDAFAALLCNFAKFPSFGNFS